MPDQAVFESKVAFNAERVGAAALYCSDGRYGEQMDDFLHNGCKWPRYDRLALPGGPAAWSGQLALLWEEDTLRKYLEFLVRTHDLKRLALIAHEGCGFYREWLRVPPERIEERQRTDLAAARVRIRQVLPALHVHLFFARREGARVQFIAVE
jgi:hypothetical protein